MPPKEDYTKNCSHQPLTLHFKVITKLECFTRFFSNLKSLSRNFRDGYNQLHSCKEIRSSHDQKEFQKFQVKQAGLLHQSDFCEGTYHKFIVQFPESMMIQTIELNLKVFYTTLQERSQLHGRYSFSKHIQRVREYQIAPSMTSNYKLNIS